MRNGRTRAATSTEYIVIVTAIAVVLIVSLTVYGQKIMVLLTGVTKSLDRGQPTRRDSAMSYLDIYTDTTIANPRGTTNPQLTAARNVPAIGGIPFDPALSESDRNRLMDALNRLPPALRDVGIVGVTHTGAQNAYFNPGSNQVRFGPFACRADGISNLNDFLYVLTGQQQNWSLERILHHEMVHAYQHHNPVVADSFLNLDYDARYHALQADPALVPARNERAAALAAVRAAAGGSNDPAVLERVLGENPALADRLYAANRVLTDIMASHNLPSRFPGDTHAGGDAAQAGDIDSGRAEYFAMVMELARSGGDMSFLSQAERDWVANHPELIR